MFFSNLIELRLSVIILSSSRTFSHGQSSRARMIPVISGQIDDCWPKTATLRDGRWLSLATYVAPIMVPHFLSEPSVATTILLRVYAARPAPTEPSRGEAP